MIPQTQHTPIPWTNMWSIHPGDVVFTSDGKIVASCKWTHDTPDVREANARLIVRAVNSHTALIGALEALLRDADGSGWASVHAARAVVATARGDA